MRLVANDVRFLMSAFPCSLPGERDDYSLPLLNGIEACVKPGRREKGERKEWPSALPASGSASEEAKTEADP